MEEEKVKLLINKIKEIKSDKNKYTSVLDNPHLKKCIEMKLKEGRYTAQIHKAILETGCKISLVTFRKWIKKNFDINDSKSKI